eukprot:CAMPEP_0172524590 /NCGR_PEP_ID=MMETSP1066-20121228/294271_1 /TAXON_ID=671091 /ORGANISM="Coscinodiscus wailesii, Strain CCMP2513" /LENGTH=80 /DNA_ID=CAMNT_0013307731 /DNA_START=1012 /DNA_END=1255 /DNA_ORIENTATION=+
MAEEVEFGLGFRHAVVSEVVMEGLVVVNGVREGGRIGGVEVLPESEFGPERRYSCGVVGLSVSVDGVERWSRRYDSISSV